PARRGNLLARDPATMAWATSEWPLPMRKLDVDVVIENGVARTTIDQTFYNPTYRTLEGIYSFPLPSDAAISRLAMYVDGTLVEGGIVERQRGRQIYESIVYRRRDPALLEQMAGNEFRIRVFPLPAHQEKRLFLSYVEPLTGLYGSETLRVPLPELDQAVAQVNVRIHLHDGEGWTLRSSSHALTVKDQGTEVSATWHDEKVILGDDLLIQLSPRGESESEPDSNSNTNFNASKTQDTGGHHGRGASVNAVHDGDHWLLRVRPAFDVTRRAQARRFVVLYDTSASRDTGEIAAQERLLGHLLRSIDSDDRLTVLAFDTTVRTFGPLQPIREIDAHALRVWSAREGAGHVGATDLAAALRSARTIVDQGAREDEAAVILYLGDGLVSGETQDAKELATIIGEGATFVAAALGDPIDTQLLGTIADATGGLVTEIDASEKLAWRARELIATIATPRMIGIQATLLGSDGQALKDAPIDISAHSLSEGEDLLLTTTSKSPPTSVEIRATVDGQPFHQRLPVPAADSNATYVSTLWARARIAALLSKDDH
ncbi:MAG TPA: VWA domain-containing protein, partial [Nannocystis exedens]|nr:VWA domain-containing protein [Nannocystis exedens]